MRLLPKNAERASAPPDIPPDIPMVSPAGYSGSFKGRLARGGIVRGAEPHECRRCHEPPIKRRCVVLVVIAAGLDHASA